MTEYLDTTKAFPHCPGCGHPHVLRSLNDALKMLDISPTRGAIVTDIGCVGLADSFFPTTHTVHTLHGRSVAIASGISLGKVKEEKDPALKPIVLIGDGGVGIGLLHVVHAAQMNVDVTVLVHNNLLYGMTGGQHSVLTLDGMKTTTTPDGSLIPPLDLGAILVGAGAGFFARAVAPSEELPGIIKEAVSHPGFSCVEIFELCPTFASVRGGITGKKLQAIPEERGYLLGVTTRNTTRPTFPLVPRQVKLSPPENGENKSDGIVPDPDLQNLRGCARLVLAGRAGERIQSATLFAARAATAAGLYATIRADNPVTQGSGFSLAELTVSSQPIDYTGLVNPDLVLVTAPEGYAQLKSRGFFTPPGNGKRYVLDEELEPPNDMEVERHPMRKTFGAKNAALGILIEEINRAGWWDRKAWKIAAEHLPPGRKKQIELLLGDTIKGTHTLSL